MSEERSLIVALDRYTEKTIAHSGAIRARVGVFVDPPFTRGADGAPHLLHEARDQGLLAGICEVDSDVFGIGKMMGAHNLRLILSFI